MPKIKRPRIAGPAGYDDDRDEAPRQRAAPRAPRDIPYSVAWFRDRVATYALGTIICGAAMLAIAAWMGGSLGMFGQRMTNGFNVIAGWAGLSIEKVQVNPEVDSLMTAKILEAADVKVGDNIMMADPYTIRSRIERIDSIGKGGVAVYRAWPSRITIEVEQRQPIALWQDGSQGASWRVIDQRGRTFSEADPAQYVNLPHIVGQDAADAAATLVMAMAEFPDLAARMETAHRMGGRRWDVKFKGGAEVSFPDDARLVEALGALNLMQAQTRALDLPVTHIDARHSKHFAMRPMPGAPEDPTAGGA